MNELQTAIERKIAHGGGLSIYADMVGARGGRVSRYQLRLYCSPHLSQRYHTNCIYLVDVKADEMEQMIGKLLWDHFFHECFTKHGHCFIDELRLHAVSGTVAQFIIEADLDQILESGHPVGELASSD